MFFLYVTKKYTVHVAWWKGNWFINGETLPRRLFVYSTKVAERGKQGKSTIIEMVNGNAKYNENR